MATEALVTINKAVDDFLLGYKKPTDDAFIYLRHACQCFQDYTLYDGLESVITKVTVNANKWIDMPSDMIGFNDLLVLQSNGRFWSCTQQSDIITTTTFTGLVEGRDSTIGEGAAITDPKVDTYGGVGGVNDYNYSEDWKTRRIYTEGFGTETVVLDYMSSGIEATGTTYIPVLIIPMIDAYLLWKETYWIPNIAKEREAREKDYNKAELKIRNFINAMSYNQWRDLLLSITTQTAIR